MCSLVVRRRGNSPRRFGNSRHLSRRGLSPNRNSSRVPSSAAAETPEGRAPKVPLHAALRRALNNSTKPRNAKAGRRLSSHARVGRVVVSNVRSDKVSARQRSAPWSSASMEGWPAGHP